MSEVGKWASGQVWILYRNKKIAAKQKNCENICIIRYYFVSLQHSCKTDKTQRILRPY